MACGYCSGPFSQGVSTSGYVQVQPALPLVTYREWLEVYDRGLLSRDEMREKLGLPKEASK